jgi:hypothetical protein
MPSAVSLDEADVGSDMIDRGWDEGTSDNVERRNKPFMMIHGTFSLALWTLSLHNITMPMIGFRQLQVAVHPSISAFYSPQEKARSLVWAIRIRTAAVHRST